MYRLSDEVRSTRTEDGGIILDIRSGRMLQVNPVGAQIIELLRQRTALAELARSIAQMYAISEETARTDVQEFLQTLETYGLLCVQEHE